MQRRNRARLLAVLVVALVVLHLVDFRGAVDHLAFGWIPWDLAYHLLWMVAAGGVILYMTERVWPDED